MSSLKGKLSARKKWTALAGGVLTLVTASGVLVFHFGNRAPAAGENSFQPSTALSPRAHGPEETRIAKLAQKKTDASRDELVKLYVAWAEKPERENDRRAIVSHILRNEDPLLALNLIVSAVSRDPTALENDRMLSTIARDMVSVWKSAAFIAKGRDLLRLSEDVKTKALLAESLAWRINAPVSDLAPMEGERHELASDLIQTHLHATHSDLKRRTLECVEMVAGPEVAEVLANPANAENSRLARRLEQEQPSAGPNNGKL
jgi:hypothetical protein